ncbi:MAG: type II toxin-antitoxin system RatA family toxin [Wolbachia endosymbiont of Fragariocoptes setiger]|nr:type II toxin-antitoxin system RatA family toxin [Wolbachia endosymbiont of Fragariocoptes setiger]
MSHKYQEQGIFSCSCHKIFQIVLDVERYPDFVPWCEAVYIREKTDNQMVVDLLATFHGIKGQYTSEVIAFPPRNTNEALIEVQSSNGIFQYLYNKWQFTSIDDNKTMIKFYIEFKFKSNTLSLLLSAMYKYTQRKIVKAFKNRAERILT